MSIRIKKPDTNQRVAIDESRLVPDNAKVIKQKSTDPSGGETITSKTNKSEEATQNRELEISILEFYEQELIPLQLVIRNLRDEIDVLAAQQLVFKDKIFSANKTKTRAVHSNKKCYGCLKK
uniref:SFRICE_018112 n=1 Tax=Spodoptera frugiperda TaxID=7108 RepID=A0A2H1WQK2_SPOFR